jgi:hypothetical protein
VGVAIRNVATANKVVTAGAGGLMELTLTLAPGYRALASRAGGLSGTADILFSARGHSTLRQSIAISFLRRTKASRAKRASKRVASKARHGR